MNKYYKTIFSYIKKHRYSTTKEMHRELDINCKTIDKICKELAGNKIISCKVSNSTYFYTALVTKLPKELKLLNDDKPQGIRYIDAWEIRG